MARIFTLKKMRHLPIWLAWILAFFMRLYAWTLRRRIQDPHGILASLKDSPVIFTLWHNRILLAAPLLPKAMRPLATVLVSASRDGEYISTILGRFGIRATRGSSSRRGAQALLELRHALDQGISPVITVDGPRGPCYTVHPGAIHLSRKSNCRLIPVSINYSRHWSLRSWDKMQLPLPFARATIVFGAPVELPAESPPEETTDALKQAILAITVD